MLIAVDAGNTSTRLALFNGAFLCSDVSFDTDSLDVSALSSAFSSFRNAGAADTVWISSVVPSINPIIDSAAQKNSFECRFLRPGKDDIIPNSLKTPHTTGCDRLLSALAAGVLYTPDIPYAVIQCGSAATIDFIDKNGCFRGGFILPGPRLWMRALAEAAQLPDLSNKHPDWNATDIGTSTNTAMMNGMVTALPRAVATAALHIHKTLVSPQDPDAPPRIIVTGGWGDAVARIGGSGFICNPDLVLHGIRIFAHRSTR